jgi:mono/diheme cytochrome c family protein
MKTRSMKIDSTNKLAVLAALAALFASCSEADDPKTPEGRGHYLYRMFCLACHNADPTQPGSQGPDIAGSPLELVRAKVLRNEYPPGYTPKRTTKNMAAPMALTDAQIEDLVAYLADAAKPKDG